MVSRWAAARRGAGACVSAIRRAGGTHAGARSIASTATPPPLLPPQSRRPLGPARPQPSISAALSSIDTEAARVVVNAQLRNSLPDSWPGKDAWLRLLDSRRDALAQLEQARGAYKHLKAESSRVRKEGGDAAEINAQTRQAATDIKALERDTDEMLDRIVQCRLGFPNHTHPDVPLGPEENAIVRSVFRGVDHDVVLPTSELAALRVAQRGASTMTLQRWQSLVDHLAEHADVAQRRSAPDHLTLASQLHPQTQPTLDLDAGRQAVGPSWPFILGPLAMLEQALLRHATSIALARGFHLVSPPVVIKTDIAERCGFKPRQGRGGQTYFVESSSVWAERDGGGGGGAAQESSSTDNSNTPAHCLVGTAEISLGALVSNRTFDSSSSNKLPLRLLAITPSFRAEDGGRGTDTKGLYRLHQFQKAEMFIVSAPDLTQSNTHLQELLSIQQDLLQSLQLTHRILDMPSEELGASAYRKYDIEAWMPGRGGWGEVSSASNCTDFQASRLHIKEKANRREVTGGSIPAHTLNATLCAVPRLIVALLEQYGVREGKLRLPRDLERHWIGYEEQVEWVDSTGRQGEEWTEGELTSALDAWHSDNPSLGSEDAMAQRQHIVDGMVAEWAPVEREESAQQQQAATTNGFASTDNGQREATVTSTGSRRSYHTSVGRSDHTSVGRTYHTSVGRCHHTSVGRCHHTSVGRTSHTSARRKFHTTTSPSQEQKPSSPTPTTLLHRLQSRLTTLSKQTGTDPASLTASFFILHELTALLPLVILFYLFSLFEWGESLCGWFINAANDDALWRRKVGQWLNEGVKRVERLARKRGLWGVETSESDGMKETSGEDIHADTDTAHTAVVTGRMANAVSAYVVVKALLAPRLLASFYLSPAFARLVFEPVKRRAQAVLRKMS